MERCPYCAEEIQEHAIKCKHCGSSLTMGNTDVFDRSSTIFVTHRNIRYGTLDVAMIQGHEASILGGQYRILKKICEGEMGIVHLAEDMELGNRKVAVKILPPLLARNPRAVENFRREALIHARSLRECK